jgi:hypothetical protein
MLWLCRHLPWEHWPGTPVVSCLLRFLHIILQMLLLLLMLPLLLLPCASTLAHLLVLLLVYYKTCVRQIFHQLSWHPCRLLLQPLTLWLLLLNQLRCPLVFQGIYCHCHCPPILYLLLPILSNCC